MATTLRRRMTVSTIGLIAGALVLMAGSLVAVRGIVQNIKAASEEYEELRIIEALDLH
jgi:hypothetical protein